MTNKTQIAELREHNRHIVAHLTRSNPRRPLSSAEVLTLESAKLVVAALSVREGIPDVDHSEYWFEHEGKLLFDGALFNSRVAIFIDSQLEAAEARIAELEKCNLEYATHEQKQEARIAGIEKNLDAALHREKRVERQLLAKEAELAALRGDAVPVVVLPDEITHCLAALAAAISLLEKGNKKAAPSDRMFDMMLNDYRNALASARSALLSIVKPADGEEG